MLDGQDLIYDSSGGGRDRYRTQRDDGRLIEYIPSQNKWEVRDREGRLFEYGKYSDRRVNNSKTGETFSWLLQNAYDAHGNWIRYTYEIVQGVPYITYVHWGTGASLTQMMGFFRTQRPDHPVTYSAGFRQQTDSRINVIRTWSLVGGAFQRASQYSLEYDQDPASGRTRLAGVTRIASDNLGTVPSHAFTYTESVPGFDSALTNYIANSPAIEPGFMEELFLPSALLMKNVIDLDGDAIADVYRFDESAGYIPWPGDGSEYLNTPGAWTGGFLRWVSGTTTEWDTLDMDGDRIPDQVDALTLSPAWSVHLGSPTGFSGSVQWVSGVIGTRIVDTVSGDQRTTRDLLDLTGDGLPDRVDSSGPGSSWTVTPNGGVSGEQGSWLGPLSWSDPANTWIQYRTASGDDRSLLLDINGDGLLDRVYHNGTSWRVAFNFGGGFDTAAEQSLVNAPATLSLTSGTCKTSHLVDVNGDGFPDQVSVSGAQWTVQYGTGEGFQAVGVNWTPSWSGSGADPRNCVIDLEPPNGNSTLEDVNSDGLVDWILTLDEVYLNTGPQPGLLESATNPLGGVTSFAYGTSAKPSGTCGNALNPDLPLVRPVVSRIEIDDAFGTAMVDEYCFAGGGYDRAEREFRGFGTVTRTQLEGGEPSTEFLHEYVIDPAFDRACGRELGREVVTDLFTGQTVGRKELDHLVVSGPTALPDRWDACLLTEVRIEDVEGDEPGRKMSRTTIDFGTTPEDQLPQVILEYGEVDPTDPETDLGNDGRRTLLAYASPTSTDRHLIGSLSGVEITDLAGTTTLSHERRYYDGLPLGQVSQGAVTKVENLKDDAPLTWVASATTQYDAYGNETLITGPPTADDPTGYQVAISYDTKHHAFPTEITRSSDTATPLTTSLSYADAECAQGLAPPPGLGLPCKITRPGNLVERLGYDSLAHLTRIERANGRDETLNYCPSGIWPCTEDVITATLTADVSTTLTLKSFRDGLGRTYREEQPGSSSTTVVVTRTFDDRGRIATETIPHFSTTSSPLVRVADYDALGRIASLLEEDGTTTRTWSYAPWGVVEEVFFGSINPSNRRSYTLRRTDGRGRLIQVDDYENAVSLGTPLMVTALYDALDRLIEVKDPIANDASLCSGLGPNCSAQDHTTSISYDLLGRRETLADPDSGNWTYTYDDAGLLLEERDGAGRGSDYAYDQLQRVTQRLMVPVGNGSESAGFVYGTNSALSSYGRLITVTALSGGTTTYDFSYDAAGRLEEETQSTPGYSGSLTSSFTYDQLDRTDHHTFPDGAGFDYNYDGLWLTEVQASGAGYTGPVLVSATYDASGRPEFYSVGERSDQAGVPVLTLTYGYDSSTARLNQIVAAPTGDSTRTLGYTFDGLGRLANQSVNGQSRSFQYDGLSRLTQAVGPWEGGTQLRTWSYSYDPLGNLLAQTSSGSYTRSWQYNHSTAPRFLTTFTENASSETMTREPGGNPATRNGTEQFIWNAQNRLHKTTANDSRSYYDAFDQRVRQQITGTNATNLIYAGPDFEYDTAQDVSIKYLVVGGQRIASLAISDPFGAFAWPGWLRPWLPWLAQLGLVLAAGLALLGVAGLLLQGFGGRPPVWLGAPASGLLAFGLLTLTLPIRAWAASLPHGSHSESLLAYITDHLGSVRGVVDRTGVVVGERDYTPFGMTVSQSGTFDLRHRFTGQPEDDAAGFYDYGARMYDPRWGRFLSPDSLVQSFDSQGLNRYAYVLNDPASLIDPTGTEGEPWFPETPLFRWDRPLNPIELTFGEDGNPPGIALPFPPTPAPQSDPRALTSGEQTFLENLTGQDFSGVNVDQGFLGESFAAGQVRSDSEINVFSGFSKLSATEQLALLSHESAHIVQRRAGTLNNFKGFFSHLGARITGGDLYAFPNAGAGSFQSLNFEQQGVVLENTARLMLGQTPAQFLNGRNLSTATVLRLYGEFRAGGP